MHGKGIYTWQDGRRYEGEYVDDKKHGYGIYTWADGRKYEGYWAYGKQHGKGKYLLPDGSIKIGLWQNGKRISWVDDENEVENQRGRKSIKDYGNYSDNYNLAHNQNYYNNNSQASVSPNRKFV